MSTLPLPKEFPISEFPPMAIASVLELQKNTGAPIELIACSTLTAMSLAIQGLVNVRRMDGLEGPVSTWYMIIAESGERKTAIDEKNLKPIREFEAEQAKRYEKKMLVYEAILQAWQVEQKVILAAIKKNAAKEQSTEELKRRLEDHASKFPKRPRLIRFLYDDASPAALKASLNGNWNSIGLISDEGVGILSGDALTDLSLPNRMWGGAQIQVDRANKSFSVNDPRLTLAVMVQPGPLRRHFERKGVDAREQGFLARFNFCYPLSTQGNRYIFKPVITWAHLPTFQAKIRKLAELNIGADGEPPKKILLSFTHEAQTRWIDVYNDIESRVNPGREYFNIKDYAAKIADNVARLAALFHFFEGQTGQISIDTLERAIKVSAWFTDEFLRLFSPTPQIPQAQLDAERLEIWIAQYMRRVGTIWQVKRNYVFQCITPIALRNKNRFSAALDVLIGSRKIYIFRQGKTCWIGIEQMYFTSHQIDWLCKKTAANN